MASVLAGATAGFVGAVVMTGLLAAVDESGPLPSAAFVARVAGGSPEEYPYLGLVLHLVYGMIAGIVFAVGVSVLNIELGSLIEAAGLGLAYGIVLRIFGMVFWMRMVIGMEHTNDAKRMVTYGLLHIVYGVVVGGIVKLGVVA